MGFPGTGDWSYDHCEPLCGHWELNPGLCWAIYLLLSFPFSIQRRMNVDSIFCCFWLSSNRSAKNHCEKQNKANDSWVLPQGESKRVARRAHLSGAQSGWEEPLLGRDMGGAVSCLPGHSFKETFVEGSKRGGQGPPLCHILSGVWLVRFYVGVLLKKQHRWTRTQSFMSFQGKSHSMVSGDF